MTRYAFLIGCENYSNFSNIAFCESDVQLIEETLLEYCDYEPKNVKRIFQYKGCDDTPNNIYNGLKKMIESAEKGDSILFYFAGHGVKEEEKGYLLLADSKASDFRNTALDLAEINELLRESNIDCFMILDACHSGILARSAFISSVSDIISDTGCITLASCSANEESYPYVEMEQGVFTYYLCEEIKKNSLGDPIFIEKLKIKVCNDVTEWGKRNYKIQTPTLSGQIVGNKAFACRNCNDYVEVKDSTSLGKKKIIDNMSVFLEKFATIADEEMKGLIKNTYDGKENVLTEEDETQLFYTSVLKRWLEDNTELNIKNIMVKNNEWRVFGQYYVYMAYHKNGEEWIVMLNILKKYNYSNVLHAIKNLKEIRDYYSKFGKIYKYYQLILISQSREKELKEMLEKHTKLQRIYNNQQIKNEVVYLQDGKFNYVNLKTVKVP